MKRKRTAAEKRARREGKKKYKIIFINGKQKWVPREPHIHGMPVDEFIRRNADPIWLHQNEMWEFMPQDDQNGVQVEWLISGDDDPIEFDQDENCEHIPQDDDDWEIPF